MSTQTVSSAGRRVVENLTAAVAEQEAWMAEHGGDEAGYIARYGSVVKPEHYGNGGEAIFRADTAHLERLKTDLARVRGKR